jgi:Sensors of blue-light using FAD
MPTSAIGFRQPIINSARCDNYRIDMNAHPRCAWNSRRTECLSGYSYSLREVVNDLIQCIYSSAATAEFAECEIPQLLEKTRAANAARGISGMLLYIEDSFFQVLEGPSNSVDTVYQKISADTRHKHVTLIIREPIAERSFGEWTMGFATVGRLEAGELVGENDFFAQALCFENLDPGRAKKLLTAFRRGRWRAEHTGQHRVHRGMK